MESPLAVCRLLVRGWLVACWLLLVGCASQPSRDAVPVRDVPHLIHVVQTGWHTSLIVEAAALQSHSPRLQQDFQQQKYLRLGWGDGDYFTGKNTRWTSATRALFASGYSALQVLAYDYEPWSELVDGRQARVAISAEGMVALAGFVERSIARDDQGAVIMLEPSKANDNLFYLAAPRYGLFSNCNTWSVDALRVAGLPVRGLNLTASRVHQQISRIARIQQQAGVLPVALPASDTLPPSVSEAR